jgi:hypothetical protein
MLSKNLLQEYNHQIQNLIEKSYHQAAGMSESEFLKKVEPLKAKVATLNLPDSDFEKGYLPFVIVVTSDLVPTAQAMKLVEKDGKTGITKLFPHEPTDFNTIPEVAVPNGTIYLLIDIDRGQENINQPPSEAMEKIRATGRSPLTIDEGVALVTHYPEFLRKNNCFSLLASRHAGDQRVPAIWINSDKNPNLGWCWNGNPHTWLGSASCSERFA